MELSEQTVLVTGGGRGLGRRHRPGVRARVGARLVVNYRHSREAAEALAAEIDNDRALAVQADVTDARQVTAMLETAQAHFKTPVTTVINNALADFSFNGDARARALEIGWDAFAEQFEGACAAR